MEQMTILKMPRTSRAMALRPVNSLKHVIDIQGGLIAGTQVLTNLIDVTDNPVITAADDNATASVVKSFFLNVQVAATGTAALANVYMMIYKNPGNAIGGGNIPDANVVGASDFRKQIFHQEMIMTEKNTTAIPRTLFKGVLRIPKHFQRNGADDTIVLALFSPGVNFDFCFQCIYKEFR